MSMTMYYMGVIIIYTIFIVDVLFPTQEGHPAVHRVGTIL